MAHVTPDFLNLDTLETGVPHEAYRRLRDEDPVSWHPSEHHGSYWLLTRHADVHQASIDSASYSSWRGSTVMHDAPEQLEMLRLMLINMDPPQHTRYRRLITRAFAARAVEKLEPAVRAMCRALVNRMADEVECDFVTDVASPLPTSVIFELLGVPAADRPMLTDASNVMIDKSGTETALASAMQMYGYSIELSRERREHPGDDLVSQLTKAEIDGEKLSDEEINAFFLLLVVAGNETTRNLIAGGLLALLSHRDQLQLVRDDLSLLPSAVEEMLRYVSPVAQFRRTANRDIALHGTTIREGDKVILAHISANHDERVFAEPSRFDVARTPNPHVAFGVGPHLCLGATLARLETRLLFDELLGRFRSIEPIGEPRRLRSNFVNGFKSVPVRFSLR